MQTTTTETETVTDYEDLIVTQYTEVWNDGWIGTWEDYQYSYYSTTTDSTSDSSETITSTSTEVTEGTGTVTTSSSDSTSTSGGTATLGYYTTQNNSKDSANCTDLTSTSCVVTRVGVGGDSTKVVFNPSNTLLVIVQPRSSSVLESQVFGTTSGYSNTVVLIQNVYE